MTEQSTKEECMFAEEAIKTAIGNYKTEDLVLAFEGGATKIGLAVHRMVLEEIKKRTEYDGEWPEKIKRLKKN